MGDGSKIRGLRAHIIIADEFASISPDIYETVVSGFAAVSATPIQNVKEEAKKTAMIEAGVWNTDLDALNTKMGNQAIISGTADYSFKHFAKYWRRYKTIIESRGDKKKLEEMFKGEIPESFNWNWSIGKKQVSSFGSVSAYFSFLFGLLKTKFSVSEMSSSECSRSESVRGIRDSVTFLSR
jgi:hypothetical protein